MMIKNESETYNEKNFEKTCFESNNANSDTVVDNEETDENDPFLLVGDKWRF